MVEEAEAVEVDILPEVAIKLEEAMTMMMIMKPEVTEKIEKSLNLRLMTTRRSMLTLRKNKLLREQINKKISI